MNRSLGVALILLTAACSDQVAPEPTYVVVDGWTGEVVVHSASDLENAPYFEMVEQLRLGTLDGPPETQFFRIADADVAGDELFILDSGHDEVRVFDLGTGEYRRTISRRGEGPGELLGPIELNIHGDTLAISGTRRVSLFALDGTFLTSGPGSVGDASGRFGRPIQAGPNWYRSQAVRRAGPPPSGEIYRDTTILFATDALSGVSGPELLRYPGGERYLDESSGFGITPFFSPNPVVHGGADGNVYYTPADEYRVDIIDAATGREVRRVVSTMQLPPVTEEMVEGAIEADRKMLEGRTTAGGPPPPGFPESLEKRKDLPLPPARQLTNAIRVAADGRWALIRGDLDANPNELGDPGHWDVFGPEGELLGRFVTAPGANIRRFTGDYLISRETDDLDVQYLVVYRLELR